VPPLSPKIKIFGGPKEVLKPLSGNLLQRYEKKMIYASVLAKKIFFLVSPYISPKSFSFATLKWSKMAILFSHRWNGLDGLFFSVNN
jgi:hypothetical protein